MYNTVLERARGRGAPSRLTKWRAQPWQGAPANPNINTISLISPTTKENRVELIANNSTGFIYYVNLRGVTGSSNLNISEIENNIGRIKKYTDLPTLAGFGIKTAEDAKTLAKFSDGIIIGSSIVEMINEASTTKEFD